MLEEDRPIQFFKCKKCGVSMDDEESTWMVDVKWPVKLKVKKDGSIGYMLANMEDEDILDRLDLSVVLCDACRSDDIEIKEWDDTPEWAVAARKKAAEEKENAAKDTEAPPEEPKDE